ncbi:MAG: hypothetical protein IPK62_02230 [Bacteroidetes bacterium]|nr:hypothetical protein [Bacteroidota bacterium]MBK8143889.1 hypothetical protein [Bacteroidota bacterium]MBP6314023.1 hypothetical protein [Chitinophagaceae bacterium]
MRSFLLIFTITLTSCFNRTYRVDDFTTDELIWVKPFTKTDTAIFISGKGEKDTIIFIAPKSAKDSTRNFEQGFSNTNYLTVKYDFTQGSYHQFAMMGDGKTRYDQSFFNASRSSAGYGSLEIGFIGTLFCENIKDIQKVNDTTYFFDSNKADYSGMNVEKGIKNFTFNTRLGVIEFVDDRNIKWRRK